MFPDDSSICAVWNDPIILASPDDSIILAQPVRYIWLIAGLYDHVQYNKQFLPNALPILIAGCALEGIPWPFLLASFKSEFAQLFEPNVGDRRMQMLLLLS